MSDYPLHFGKKQFTGPAKYLLVIIILALASLLYIALSRWLQDEDRSINTGWSETQPLEQDLESDSYDDGLQGIDFE